VRRFESLSATSQPADIVALLSFSSVRDYENNFTKYSANMYARYTQQ